MKAKLIFNLSFALNIILIINLPDSTIAQVDSSKIRFLNMSIEDLLNVEVVTVSKTMEKSSEAPAKVYVINEEHIKIRGYTNLEEVLEDIPEIEIQKKASVEYSNFFTFRGIEGSEKFIIMMDGMRINSPTGTPLPIVHNYQVANARQIEVILGPASALYGVDAFTGIVNIITKKGYEVKGFNVNSSYGMYNTADNTFVGGLGNRDISFSITGKYYFSKEPDFPEIFKSEYSWYHERYSTNGEVLLSPFSDATVTLPVYDYETPTNSYAIHAKLNIKNFEAGYFKNSDSHSSSLSTKPEYTIYSKETLFKEGVESMYASHNFESDNKKLRIQTTLSHSKDEIDPETHYINTYTSYIRGYKYAYNKSLKIEEQIFYKLNDKNSVVTGFSYEDLSALAKTGDLPFAFNKDVPAALQNQYYLGTNIIDSAGKNLSIMQDFYYLDYRNIGTYLQFYSNMIKELGLTLGLRYDYNTRYGYTVNPRVGLAYFPIEKLKVKLLYGKAYLAPSPYRAYQHYGSFIPVTDSVSGEVIGLTASFWRLPETDLKPQKISTYEAAFSYLVNSNIAVSSNVFYNDMKDILSSTGFTGQEFHGIPVSYIERPVNKGTAKSYGGTLRLDAKLNLSAVDINSYLAYTFIDGEIGGGHIAFSARNTIKGGIDLSLNRLSLSPRFIFRTQSYHRSLRDEDGNIVTNDPFTLVNLNVRYLITYSDVLQSSVYIKITNLLNNKYYNLPIGGRECFPNVPQDPVRVNIGLNVKFL